LRGRTVGEVVDFVFQSEDAAKQAASSLEKDGHELLTLDGATASIRRGGTA
jgi:hypothetical protein